MAEQDVSQNTVASAFPPPPPFWQHFTPDNLARVADLRQEYAEQNGIADPSTVRISGLPSHLRVLQPPVEPATAHWRVFSENYELVDELPKLEDKEIRRLFPSDGERDQDGKHFDRATILKRLAKSLILNFLELVGVLGINPADAEEKITDIRDILLNIHHLINEYRPHQARESLIALMQAHLDRTRAETNAIRDAKEKVERLLEGLGSLKMDEEDILNGELGKKQDLLDPEMEMWESIRNEYP